MSINGDPDFDPFVNSQLFLEKFRANIKRHAAIHMAEQAGTSANPPDKSVVDLTDAIIAESDSGLATTKPSEDTFVEIVTVDEEEEDTPDECQPDVENEPLDAGKGDGSCLSSDEDGGDERDSGSAAQVDTPSEEGEADDGGHSEAIARVMSGSSTKGDARKVLSAKAILRLIKKDDKLKPLAVAMQSAKPCKSGCKHCKQGKCYKNTECLRKILPVAKPKEGEGVSKGTAERLANMLRTMGTTQDACAGIDVHKLIMQARNVGQLDAIPSIISETLKDYEEMEKEKQLLDLRITKAVSRLNHERRLNPTAVFSSRQEANFKEKEGLAAALGKLEAQLEDGDRLDTLVNREKMRKFQSELRSSKDMLAIKRNMAEVDELLSQYVDIDRTAIENDLSHLRLNLKEKKERIKRRFAVVRSMIDNESDFPSTMHFRRYLGEVSTVRNGTGPCIIIPTDPEEANVIVSEESVSDMRPRMRTPGGGGRFVRAFVGTVPASRHVQNLCREGKDYLARDEWIYTRVEPSDAELKAMDELEADNRPHCTKYGSATEHPLYCVYEVEERECRPWVSLHDLPATDNVLQKLAWVPFYKRSVDSLTGRCKDNGSSTSVRPTRPDTNSPFHWKDEGVTAYTQMRTTKRVIISRTLVRHLMASNHIKTSSFEDTFRCMKGAADGDFKVKINANLGMLGAEIDSATRLAWLLAHDSLDDCRTAYIERGGLNLVMHRIIRDETWYSRHVKSPLLD